ncbi:MAG TPA: hypothetical protein VLJ18_02480 [Thermoanaerobaculia bacterium]|nr:hypothetical protein [Thermoanaerobaculia bacterium]
MKRLAVLPSALAFAALLALPAAATGGDDALALVPADAASVGVIHVADLRTSPLAARVFSDTDHLTVDGDAAHFLAEAHLNPKEDVDTVVAAGSPKGAGGSAGWGLVLFEGRFDPAALSAAIAARGAIRKSTPAGDYFLLPEKGAHASRHEQGAIAFASEHLVIAGNEASVVAALAQRSAGGTAFRSGAGLGRHLGRIDSGASAWALVDVTRLPVGERSNGLHASRTVDGKDVEVKARSGHEDAALTVVSSMKSVSLLALQATAKGDALKLAATGLVSDDETAGLMEDALRGVLAAWRLAAQEKSPETVSMIRKFSVTRDKSTVSISGTLPGSAVRALAEKKHARVD